jgi:flavin reductase (DIM6/NTAB) family NADH-FMN oxidoreductase RutF
MKRVYRKRPYPLDETRRFLEPGPIVLVSSKWQGIPNIMTMGWHMMLGFKPALFGCYIWEENPCRCHHVLESRSVVRARPPTRSGIGRCGR